ncbi:MAG: hypothetical protein ABIH00_06245 [Armatimonadota bacterium]
MADATTKQELISDLQKLKEVSAKNETLTQELAEGKGDTQKLQGQVQECIDEQSRIVDKFVSLSDNKELVENFQSIVKGIEEYTGQLEKETDQAKAQEIKDNIMKKIEEWVKCLEKIISEVIAKF